MLVDSAGAQSFHRRRFRWRGATGAIVLAPPALLSLFSKPLFSGGSLPDLVALTLAWATFVAGATLRFWATLYVGGRKEHHLVTTGPYSLCRHPLYLGSLLLGVSAGLFLESPSFLAALVAVGIVYIRATIPVEEAVLRARHGLSYEEYARVVPRYWPRGFAVQSPAEIRVDVHRLRLECARASRWIWLPILGAACTFLRAHSWWPTIFPSL